jgi:hypothetical protein
MTTSGGEHDDRERPQGSISSAAKRLGARTNRVRLLSVLAIVAGAIVVLSAGVAISSSHQHSNPQRGGCANGKVPSAPSGYTTTISDTFSNLGDWHVQGNYAPGSFPSYGWWDTGQVTTGSSGLEIAGDIRSPTYGGARRNTRNPHWPKNQGEVNGGIQSKIYLQTGANYYGAQREIIEEWCALTDPSRGTLTAWLNWSRGCNCTPPEIDWMESDQGYHWLDRADGASTESLTLHFARKGISELEQMSWDNDSLNTWSLYRAVWVPRAPGHVGYVAFRINGIEVAKITNTDCRDGWTTPPQPMHPSGVTYPAYGIDCVPTSGQAYDPWTLNFQTQSDDPMPVPGNDYVNWVVAWTSKREA